MWELWSKIQLHLIVDDDVGLIVDLLDCWGVVFVVVKRRRNSGHNIVLLIDWLSGWE